MEKAEILVRVQEIKEAINVIGINIEDKSSF